MLKVWINIAITSLLLISPELACQQNNRILYTGNRKLNDFYLEKTGSPREYIDGKDYFPYYFRSENTPILRSGEERSATLTIHGRTYNGLNLQYDTYSDEVIYSDDSLVYDNRIRQVSLNKYCISRFDLFFRHDTLHFRYFPGMNDTDFNLPDGFYEVGYDRKTGLLVRHISSVVVSMNKVESYNYRPVNFVRVSDGFEEIESRKQFVSLFGSRSEQISHFLRQNHIRIKRADKKQITDVLKYYETLFSGAY